jgi:hypothetical protein
MALSHHRIDQLSSYALMGQFFDLNSLPLGSFPQLPFWRSGWSLVDRQSFDLRIPGSARRCLYYPDLRRVLRLASTNENYGSVSLVPDSAGTYRL